MLTLFFVICIITLVTRNRILVLMVGWDLLGISSLFLIMFYPNKTAMYNSYMTICFNRVGDVFMVSGMAFVVCYSGNYRINSNFFLFFSVILALCSFTKRAQFPLSSWLPAAISAPTPISALVHSSTLVTAGVFLILKFFSCLNNSTVLIIIFVRVVSFLLGGLIGCFEFDLKKIVAFSTIRQIRICIFFTRLGLFNLALLHILFHALFKRLLFCICGCKFLTIYRDQRSFYYNSTRYSIIYERGLISIAYLIGGFFFSRSFYTKDLALEIVCCNNFFLLYILFLLSSSFTILYICKLLEINSASFKLRFRKRFKFSNIPTIFIFFFLAFNSGWIIKNFRDIDFVHLARFFDLFLIVIFIYTPLILTKIIKNNIIVLYLSLDVSFIKRIFFSSASKIFSIKIKELNFREDYIFKQLNFSLVSLYNKNIILNKNYFILIFFLCAISFYFSSLVRT